MVTPLPSTQSPGLMPCQPPSFATGGNLKNFQVDNCTEGKLMFYYSIFFSTETITRYISWGVVVLIEETQLVYKGVQIYANLLSYRRNKPVSLVPHIGSYPVSQCQIASLSSGGELICILFFLITFCL